MRVTRLIREYVEKNIRAIYKPKIDAVGTEYKARKEALEEQLYALCEQAEEKAKQMIADAGFENERSYYFDIFGEVTIEEVEEENLKRRRDLTVEMNEKIDDILYSLELGATREDLDKMIKKIQKEK